MAENRWNKYHYGKPKHNKHLNSYCDICICSICEKQVENGCEDAPNMCDDCKRTLTGCYKFDKLRRADDDRND